MFCARACGRRTSLTRCSKLNRNKCIDDAATDTSASSTPDISFLFYYNRHLLFDPLGAFPLAFLLRHIIPSNKKRLFCLR
jgi:hypothetical protein